MAVTNAFGLTASAIVGLGLGLSPALAAPILYDTGVNDAGVPLADGAAETHFTLYSAPPAGTAAPLRAATFASSPATVLWIGDDSVSRFISPSQTTPVSASPSGAYYYRLTFDLTGYNPAATRIYGQWATDDFGYGISINGSFTATQYPGGPDPNHFALFNLATGFVPGINTLDFVVGNDVPRDGTDYGPQTALRVEFSPISVALPEPASLLVLGASLAWLGIGRSRRRRPADFARLP